MTSSQVENNTFTASEQVTNFKAMACPRTRQIIQDLRRKYDNNVSNSRTMSECVMLFCGYWIYMKMVNVILCGLLFMMVLLP